MDHLHGIRHLYILIIITSSQSGNSDEAIKRFDKEIEINPQNSTCWINKGNALDDLGKSDEAMKAYDKALEIDPQDSIALAAKRGLSKQNS